jgi:LysM repeat protein
MFLEFYELFGTYGKDGKRIEESSGPGGPGEYNHAAKKYYKLGLNTQPSMGTPPKLVFGNMADESYWYVQVNKFEIRRSTQRRMLYQYEIQLTGLSPYVSTKAAGFMDSWWAKYPLSSPPNRSMLTQALKAYAFVSQSVSTLRNLISDIDRSVEMIRTSVKALGSSFESIGGEVANLNNLFTVQGTGRIATPYNVVIETRAKVDEALPIALAITGLPHEYVDALRQTKRELFLYEQNEHLFIKSTSTGGVTPAATSSATTLPEILTGVPPQKSVKDSYIQDTVPEQTVFGTDPLAGMGSIITEETVRQGETIETIARNFGVPWEHLAAVNELDYPYVADVCPPGKNVLVPGDRLKITSANAQKPMFETGTDWTVTLYGIDEFLDANGDCQIGSTGDAKTISGIPNLEMQLRHRLNSLRGDLKHLGHPVYGSNIPTFVGKPDTEVWLKLAFKEAENTFLDDPRIASIRSLELVQQGDKCSIQAALIPVNQTNVALLNIPLLF